MRKTSGPLYAYKGMKSTLVRVYTELSLGLSGKVTSMATSPAGVSFAGSLDRYVRLLSAPSDGSGTVVGKLYVTSAPTAIVPIEVPAKDITSDREEEEDSAEDDDDWGEIQQVSSDEEETTSQVRKKRRKD